MNLNTRNILENVKRDAQSKRPCLVCAEPINSRGIFFPDSPEKYGAPKGKKRIVIYALCPACMDTMQGGGQVQVEGLILSALRAEGAETN
jgi:hypothetical protein